MRTVTVKDNQIVVEVDGAKVRYPLEIVRKRINSLLQDLETWREYERLLTPLAPDVLPCGHPRSSLVRLGFGQLPYCEDCKRQNAGKA